jgi:membrane protease YdiL (CAAX protease family)
MKTLRWLDGVLIFGISYLASAVVVIPLALVLPLKEVTAISVLVLIVMSYLWLRAATGDPLGYVGMCRVRPKILLLVFIASLATLIPAMSVEAVLLEYFEAPPEIIHALEDLIRADNLPELLYVLVVAAAGASVSEELVFRGILQNSMASRVNGWAALLITSVVFGLLHTLWRFPSAFLLGVFLGFLYLRTGSLIPSLLSHAVINASAVVLFHVSERAASGVIPRWVEEDRPAPVYLIVLSVVVLAAALVSLWRETADERYPLPHGGKEGLRDLGRPAPRGDHANDIT